MLEVLDELGLADELLERAGPQPDLLELLVVVGGGRVDHPMVAVEGVVHHERLAVLAVLAGSNGKHLAPGPRAHRLASSRSARRSISSTPTSSRRPSSAPRISSGA